MVLGFRCFSCFRDSGTQYGNYHSIRGLYRDVGKENGTTIWGFRRF